MTVTADSHSGRRQRPADGPDLRAGRRRAGADLRADGRGELRAWRTADARDVRRLLAVGMRPASIRCCCCRWWRCCCSALGVAIYRLLIVRALRCTFNRGMVQIFVTFGLGDLHPRRRAVLLRRRVQSITAFLAQRQPPRIAGIFLPLPQLAGGAGLPAGLRRCCWRSRAPSSAARWKRRARIATRWR